VRCSCRIYCVFCVVCVSVFWVFPVVMCLWVLLRVVVASWCLSRLGLCNSVICAVRLVCHRRRSCARTFLGVSALGFLVCALSLSWTAALVVVSVWTPFIACIDVFSRSDFVSVMYSSCAQLWRVGDRVEMHSVRFCLVGRSPPFLDEILGFGHSGKKLLSHFFRVFTE